MECPQKKIEIIYKKDWNVGSEQLVRSILFLIRNKSLLINEYEFIWGNIDQKNIPSTKNALRIGRKIISSDNKIDYNLTAAFTNYHFEEPVEALVYPSVAHLGGWNVAVRPEVSQDRFTVVSGGIYRLREDLGYGLYNASIIRHMNTVSNSEISWHE